MAKSDAEIILEIYQAVLQSDDKFKRLKSSTFWKLFGVKSRQKKVIDKIMSLAESQGLKLTVKSGANIGEEKDDDWIIASSTIGQPSEIPLTSSKVKKPNKEWFEVIKARQFESEREVEAYFITELVDKLGFGYDDIAIGFPVQMFKGVQKMMAEADFAIFKDSGREISNVLMVIEAKKYDKGITVDHISQVQSYAKELLPAYYVITNGDLIMVYQFNGLLAQDERVLEIHRSEIEERWNDLYGYICKEATIKRKEWLINKLGQE
jgi:hypothetical protein